MTPADNVRISNCTFTIDGERHDVDHVEVSTATTPYEVQVSRPTPAPANRHQRRRYAALSRRSQTR